jgi:myo-inositol-1(or 4)-monophosphatase
MNLELLTKQVANLCRTVGLYLKDEQKNLRKSDVETKGFNNFVTYIDKNTEKRLVIELGKLLPEAGFIAEENSGYIQKERYNWVIDPLDGTTNYIHGIPVYSISIGLIDKKEVVSGVVYEVNLQECFYAWKNSNAFLNGHIIHTSNAAHLKDSIIATGFPYTDYSRLEEYLEILKFLVKNTHGIRRLGSAAVDLAYVACGRYDGFYEYGLNPWDVAAGTLILQQAGGVVSNFSGQADFLFEREIVASNALIFDELLKVIQHYTS